MTELFDQLVMLCKDIQQGMGSTLWRRELRIILALHNTVVDHTGDLENIKSMIERYNKKDGLLLSDIWDYINIRLDDIGKDEGQNIVGVLDQVTDEIADVLADMDSRISYCCNPDGYEAMHTRLDTIQQLLLELIKYNPSEE